MNKNNYRSYLSPGEKREGVSQAAFLADSVDAMSDVYGALPQMAAALHLDRVRLFTTGIEGVDLNVRRGAKARLEQFVNNLRQYYLVLSNAPFEPPDPVRWRENKALLDKDAELIAWTDDETKGMQLDDTFAIAEMSMVLRYQPDLLRDVQVQQLTPDESSQILGEFAEFNDPYDIAQALHQSGKLSGLPTPLERQKLPAEAFEKARLEFEKRSEQSYYLAQLAAARLLTEYLYAFYLSGEPGSALAIRLFKQYKDALFQDDPGLKVIMLNNFGAVLAQTAEREKSDVVRAYFEHLSRLMSRIGEDLKGFIDTLMRWHIKSELELPEYLLRYEQKMMQPKFIEEKDASTVTAEVSQGPTKEEKLTALETRIEELRRNIQLAFRDIVLSKNQRNSAGFSPFKEAFGRGFTPDGSRDHFERVLPEQARQLFDMLVYLEKTQNEQPDLRTCRQQLRQLDTAARHLAEELQALKTFANEQGLSRMKQIEWPEIFPFSERLEQLAEASAQAKWLVAKYWPTDDSVIVAEKLAAVLDSLKNLPLSENETPQRLTKEEAYQYVQDRLDILLFPKGEAVTEADVREVFKKANFTNNQLEQLEWERVRDLAVISEFFNGTLYSTKEHERFLGEKVPYFVVLFELEGHTYAIAESPLKESATYIVAEQHAAGSWSEVLRVGRRVDARQYGAEYVIHSSSAPFGDKHIEKVINKIITLHEKPRASQAKE